MVYERSEPERELRQGEIITGLQRVVLDVGALADNRIVVDLETHTYAILVSQDCDLEQDHNARQGGETAKADKLLPNLLFLHAVEITDLRGAVPQGRDIWKRIIQNKDERYHVLQRVAEDSDLAGQGIPELGIDFRRHFAIPPEEALFRIVQGTARRRARLGSPYAEHLSSRFAHYLGRVALPLDHQITGG